MSRASLVVLAVIVSVAAARPPPDVQSCRFTLKGAVATSTEALTMVYDRVADHTYTDTSVSGDMDMEMIEWDDHKNGKCYSASRMDGKWECTQLAECAPLDPLIPADAKYVKSTDCLKGSTSEGQQCDVFLLPGGGQDLMLYITADDVLSGLKFDAQGTPVELVAVEFSKDAGAMPAIPDACT